MYGEEPNDMYVIKEDGYDLGIDWQLYCFAQDKNKQTGAVMTTTCTGGESEATAKAEHCKILTCTLRELKVSTNPVNPALGSLQDDPPPARQQLQRQTLYLYYPSTYVYFYFRLYVKRVVALEALKSLLYNHVVLS